MTRIHDLLDLPEAALKQLEADGLVEKLSGRPARYVATGDGA